MTPLDSYKMEVSSDNGSGGASDSFSDMVCVSDVAGWIGERVSPFHRGESTGHDLFQQVGDLSDKVERHQLSAKAAPKKLSEAFPEPDYFCGGDYRSWELAMRLKLLHNRDHYTSAQHMMAYMYTRLSGQPQFIIQSFTRDGWFTFDTTEDFYRTLRDIFSDPNPRFTAEQKLKDLNQGGRLLDAYLGDFYFYANDACLDEQTRKVVFREGLDGEMKRELSLVETADMSDQELIRQCRIIEYNKYNEGY